jgi:hypothetical protein
MNKNYKKSFWERFQDQKQDPWSFLDLKEFKAWYGKQGKIRVRGKANA